MTKIYTILTTLHQNLHIEKKVLDLQFQQFWFSITYQDKPF